jgi:hypothetical protein
MKVGATARRNSEAAIGGGSGGHYGFDDNRDLSASRRLEVIVAIWFLDFQFVITVVSGLVTVALVITMLGKARAIGRRFARLQSDVERLSREVKQLQVAEQRRFMKELQDGTAVPQSPPNNGVSSEGTAK